MTFFFQMAESIPDVIITRCLIKWPGMGSLVRTDPVLLRPIVQSYVMRYCGLNNFVNSHISFGPMKMSPNELKGSQILISSPDFGCISFRSY